MKLHETSMGRRFFEHDFPEMVKQLKRIADALEKTNTKEK
jgi:hypothetical protein